jgi:hypothetical protein
MCLKLSIGPYATMHQANHAIAYQPMILKDLIKLIDECNKKCLECLSQTLNYLNT